MNSSHYCKAVRKKVSWKQFCALLSQDAWHGYMNSPGRGSPASAKEWDAAVMRDFSQIFMNCLALYDIDEDEMNSLLEGTVKCAGCTDMNALEAKARAEVYSLLSPRWIC